MGNFARRVQRIRTFPYGRHSPPSTSKFKEAVMEETGGMTPYDVKRYNISQYEKGSKRRIRPSMTRIKARGGY